MTSKTELLLREVGGNVAESLGKRTGEAVTLAPPAGDTKKYDGRTHRRDTGDMAIGNIIPDPTQPRKEFDDNALERLAGSIKEHGQLQAIRVRWNQVHGKWVVLAGERRYRAALKAGLPTIQCIFVEGDLSPADILEEQLIENCLREDLKPLEQALAFRTLMERKNFTGRQLAEYLHLHPSSVTHALSLLELPEDIQAKVAEGELAPSVAYEVAKLEEPQAQRELVEEVIEQGLSRQEAREAIRKKRWLGSKRKPQRRTCTVVFKTAKHWSVTVVAPKGQVSELEVAVELEALAGQLRMRSKVPDAVA